MTDDEPTDAPEQSPLEHQEAPTGLAKQWSNRSNQQTTLPNDDLDVKSEWVGITVYLPAELREELELVFREHSLESKRSSGAELKKLRHYYPLVVALGLELLEDAEPRDIAPLLSYVMDQYETEQ
ncbi:MULTISPECIES: hypothetical protein [Haloferax]|jgi:hypothetical protein|uniref:DUF8160 domain-containing protein n=6 Tax=Haloferax TaxID=2251 RepID=A0A384LPT5_HALVD|nr:MULTISPECIES: hypothetical protein [Haloferax]ADE05059.1 uncharacterized protein HVO_2089 [Haloferax volcanii DS2]ELK55969.1 hypothetical protein D320_01773 [Haloferax sp. BAB-2207]ELY33681.1 hypothetical protein C498_05733 [Haloferax volcanii DS2]ELZ75305.1 hypothetical protein C456_06517 [Haloferax lucentense DSM 14919]ELZ87945.1 hypothetical protein C452_14250 [Haloferax alexandrinus JCM 10717]